MNAEASHGRHVRNGVAAALLGLLPGWAMAAPASAEHEPGTSRYSVKDAAVEREGQPSASGRFRLQGEIHPGVDTGTPGGTTRYGVRAKLVNVAECSLYLFADGFD